MPRISPDDAGGVNVCAFLDTIAHSELGDALIAASDDGYNVLVGSTAASPHLFTSYATHPQILVKLSDTLSSTAAGRYQLLGRYYAPYAKLLGLTDFSPVSQDRIAIQQIKEQRAYSLIQAGAFEAAVHACRNIWASLPGAGYGQHENTMDSLRAAYLLNGGSVA